MSALPAPGDVRRVLVINVTRIGDTLLATPALRAIAAHFPNAAVTCLGHPGRVEVLAELPYLGKTGSITKKRAWHRGWKDVLTGRPEYDVAFVWGHDAALVRYALRKARHVVAERQGETALDGRLGLAVDMPPQNRLHAVAWYLALPQAAGIATRGYRVDTALVDGESAWARERLRADLPAGAGPVIGMQVASFPTKAYRDWPTGHFIELAMRVRAIHPGAHFILFGGPSDQARIQPVLDQLGTAATGYAGRFTLRQTLAVMSATDAYVGVDTGPTHLFSSLGKPMVVMYHPSLPSALYRPLDHPALWALDHPAAGPAAGRDIPIGEIPLDAVFAALRDALDGRASRQPGLPAPGVDPGAAPYPGDPPRK